jgi:hypothetical protein
MVNAKIDKFSDGMQLVAESWFLELFAVYPMVPIETRAKL